MGMSKLISRDRSIEGPWAESQELLLQVKYYFNIDIKYPMRHVRYYASRGSIVVVVSMPLDTFRTVVYQTTEDMFTTLLASQVLSLKLDFNPSSNIDLRFTC